MDRRQLLRYALGASSGSLLISGAWAGRGSAADPFALGVASGAPHPGGMVLWTRIAPAALPSPLAPAELRWEIAHDANFRRIAASGRAQAVAELGHSVHVEVQGLTADRWYFYRFMLGDAVSETARTRTAPAAEAMPERLRFVYASCQRWENGYYAAWRDAAEQAPDLVVFLGDYIYENALPRDLQGRTLARGHTLRRARSLEDYRERYALHKSDPDLRAAHRACPWIVTWDDHEVENDYAATVGHAAPEAFAAQRAAAYQAFYENMPLPARTLVRGLGGLGGAEALRVHERQDFGRLLRFHLLDTRQFRDPQACREDKPGGGIRGSVRPGACAELQATQRTLLGRAQEDWLAEGLADDARDGRTRWSVIAQQTLFSPRRYGAADAPVPTDTWDGYPAARARLLQALKANPPRNAVFVGGDIHQNYVCNVHAADPKVSDPIATEFCGTSISSPSGASPARIASILERNPHIVFANSEKRGYGLVDLTPKTWETRLRTVDRIEDAASPVQTLAQFVVEDGRAIIQPR
ncbi:alkaline phosphatase [Xylophilus rhododendri]|uniref:Alkaline phosphatase n=1 Tax=Xylophilus rhododendri TaxID=2697032 RepID=A0A857JBU7_9BURK|nr:alkaline phosphatase D family protein [Xylophilus rhododendri]QHJ00176.1 alkaline phosphatase [Xylophilus rhododendri]